MSTAALVALDATTRCRSVCSLGKGIREEDSRVGCSSHHSHHQGRILVAYAAAYKATMTTANMAGGFRGAGLIPVVPQDPEAVTSKLVIQVRTPPSDPDAVAATQAWVSQTPHNSHEAVSQSERVLSQINARNQGLPSATRQLAEGTMELAHENAFLKLDTETPMRFSARGGGRKRRVCRMEGDYL